MGDFFVSHLVHYVPAIAGFLVASGVIGTFALKVARWCRRLFEIVDAIDGKTQELKHNGGLSMKDSAAAMLDTQNQMLEVQKQTLERLDRLERHGGFFNWNLRRVR